MERIRRIINGSFVSFVIFVKFVLKMDSGHLRNGENNAILGKFPPKFPPVGAEIKAKQVRPGNSVYFERVFPWRSNSKVKIFDKEIK